LKPAKRIRVGDRILFTHDFTADVLSQGEFGEHKLRLNAALPLPELLERLGETPLPPYIRRHPNPQDRDRYQTVFAQHRGSVAAPTAGLHFTPEILSSCRQVGAQIAYVTLHVGLGTFAPLRAELLTDVKLHGEQFEISESNAEAMRSAQRLLCVGTTSVRAVESALLRGPFRAIRAETDLFISPGFQFQGTGALLTNFHLPKSSLLMLVSALAGRELTLAAYHHAVSSRYRFFSYGDCMLIV